MLSAWPAASMTTRAPKMVSGIPSVAAVGKARGHSGHAETVSHGWEGFRLRIKHFLHTCACTKGSVTQNSENAVNVIFRAEMLQMRLAQYLSEPRRRFGAELIIFSALGKNVNGFSLKISCKRKSKIRLFWGYCYVFLLY